MKALMNKLTKKIALALCLLAHLSVFAIHEEVEVTNTGLGLTSTITIESSQEDAIGLDPTGWFNDFRFASLANEVVFGIDQDIHQVDEYYQYKIKFDVAGSIVDGTTLTPYGELGVELELDYSPDGVYQDKQVYSFTGGVDMTIYNIQLYKWDGVSYVLVAVDRENLFLKAKLETEYYNDFDYSLVPPSIGVSLSLSGSDMIVNLPALDGAEQYDLEWAWVNRYDGTVLGGIPVLFDPTEVSYNFDANASRVRINTASYSIPMIYGEGYLLVRYRGVGRIVTNLDTDIDGQWMTTSTLYEDENIVDVFPLNCREEVHAIEDHKLNYGASMTFIENGRRNTSINFADGMMKSRQQISQINSQDELLVGSVIYDHYGRPAIGVMGSPVNQTELGYVEDLNMHGTDVPYDKSVFHKDEYMLGACGPMAAPPMDPDESVGSAHYYSASNSNKDGAEAFVPESNGYNFTQVHYANDPTGRVKRVGSVGIDHQLDATTDHYTQVMTSSQEDNMELDRYFGSEAAHFSNYSRVVSRDVHGQISVSIQDNFGRTVMSYLEGSAPVGLEAIDGNGPETMIEVDLTEFTSSGADLDAAGILMVDKKIVVADKNQIYTFKYDFEALSFTDCLPPEVCFDCIYEIEFEVVPAEGDFSGACPLKKDGIATETYTWSHTVGSITDFNIDCETPLKFSDLYDETFTLQFPRVDEYYVRKTLKVSEAPIEYYWDQYIENADAACLVPFSSFLADAMLDIDYSDCYGGSPCALNFLFEHGTFEEWEIITGGTETEYDELREEYIEDCQNLPICSQMRPILLGDVNPGGQYGDISGASGLSVFNDSDPMEYSWRHDDVTFLNDDDTPAMTTNYLDETVKVNHATITLTEFVALWNPNWAEELLGAHPEYETYLFCETYSSVFEYATEFSSTETYAEAAANGFITPVNPVMYPAAFGGSPEPFTMGDPLIDLINTNTPSGINDLLDAGSYQYDDSYEGGTNSYYHATQDLLNLTGGSTFYQMASAASDGTAFGTSTCDLDAQWEAFKRLYISRRNIILQVAMEGRALQTGAPEASCVGFASTLCTTNGYGDYADKTKRFLLFDQVMPFSFLEIMTSDPSVMEDLEDDAEAETLDFCETACESMADGWMAELSSCATELLVGTWNDTDPTYNAIRADLIAVCQGGCSAEWPFPSQYDNSGNSFQSVIESYLLAEGIPAETMDCNHYLINNPSPAKDLMLADTLSTCACDKLLSVDSEEAFEEAYGFVPVGFCKDRQTCLDIAGYDPYPGTVSWTPLQEADLEWYMTATDYGCEGDDCIDCNELEQAIINFTLDFPTASLEENPVIFTSYVNEMYGTNFNYFSLMTFKNHCDSLDAEGILTEGLSPGVFDMINFMNQVILDDVIMTGGIYPFDAFPALTTPAHIAAASCVDVDDEFVYNGSISGASSTLVISFPLALPATCVTLLCVQASFSITPIMTPEITGIYGDEVTVFQYTQSFEEAYVTPADMIAGSNFFHVTGLVADPSSGDPIEVEFQFTSGCIDALGDNLGVLCENYVPEPEDDCVDDLIANAEMAAEFEYGEYLATMKEQFIADYIETCRQVDETYLYLYQANRYHRTLFFYDVAGHLVKTVSPKGINEISDIAIGEVKLDRAGLGGSEHIPVHNFTTNYVYNGLNQPISLTTPDGGTTNFWYDNIGRLVVSQNARQAALRSSEIDGDPLNPVYDVLPAYSYSLFDELGRPIEFGEFVQPTPMSDVVSKTPSSLFTWLFQEADFGIPRYRNQVTRINYSNPTSPDAIAELGGDQGDIRNRVSSVSTNSDYVLMEPSWVFPDPDYLNHYSYDVHGNVGDFVQEIPDLVADGRQFFHTEYEFDLLSGLPRYVHFQQGEVDQYSHNFIYDGDNRLKEVYTSKDGVIWDRDAEYTYRLDGKRARTELGDVEVQGMDYAYTLHGWLKALNSGILDPEKDMGKDGHNFGGSLSGANKNVAQDALAFTMGYFDDDYARIDDANPLTNFMPEVTGSPFHTDRISLYNGNISNVTTAMMDINEERLDVTGLTYRYDQLHRFKESHVFSSNDITELNSFVNAARQNLTVGTDNTLADYEVHVDYDKNGNIEKLDRRAKDEGYGSNKMDEFSYTYPSTSNRLEYVKDAISGTSYGDIQSGQELYADDNYQYHPDGSLKSDEQEKIAYIEWYPSGKLKRIFREDDSELSDLYFEYDPMGARALKVEITKDMSGGILPNSEWNYSWYTPDANGQTMAVYQRKAANPVLFRSEAMIFGASRVGLDTRRVEIIPEVIDDSYSLDDFMLGNPCAAAGSWFMLEEPSTTYNLADVNADLEDDLEVINTSAMNFAVFLTVNTEPGETYTVEFDVLSMTVPGIRERAQRCTGSNLGGLDVMTPGSYTHTFMAMDTKSKIQWRGQGSTGSFILANIDVTGPGDVFADIPEEPVEFASVDHRLLGEKMFELGDHLGNVKEVISDRTLIDVTADDYILEEDFTISPSNCGADGTWFFWPAATTSIVEDFDLDLEDDDLTVSHGSSSNFIAFLAIATIPSETYTVNYTVLNQTTPWLKARAQRCSGGGNLGLLNGSGTGTYSYTFTAATTKTKLFWAAQGSPGGTFTLSDISIDGAGDIWGEFAGDETLALLPDVVSYSDYYPYGMEMPNRHGSLADYRYAFNGMEVDNDVSGDGNSYTTMFRQYDPRLGRWKSLDPLASKYPGASPFSAYNNNPIYFVDPLGLEGEPGSSESNPENVADMDSEREAVKKHADSGSSDDFYTDNGTHLVKHVYNPNTENWVAHIKEDDGSYCECAGSTNAPVKPAENVVEMAVNSETYAQTDNALITAQAVANNKSGITKGNDYNHSGTKSNKYFTADNGHSKPLYQNNGKFNTKGGASKNTAIKYFKVDKALTKFGYLGTLAEGSVIAWDLGSSLFDEGWTPENQDKALEAGGNLLLLAFETAVVDRALTSGVPHLMVLGGAYYLFKAVGGMFSKPKDWMPPSAEDLAPNFYGNGTDRMAPSNWTPDILPIIKPPKTLPPPPDKYYFNKTRY